MDTNSQNIQINSFIKGLNTDTAITQVDSDSYIDARNIRIFRLGNDSNQHGELRSIEGVSLLIEQIFDYSIAKILATATVRNYGILILEEPNTYIWHVIRITVNGDTFTLDEIFHSKDINDRLGGEEGVDKVSIYLKYEDLDNIKLYIADGSHYLMVLNIMDDEHNTSINGEVSKIESYQLTNINSPIFCGLTSGNLTPSCVQYSYQLYSKNGIRSDVSIPTKLIPIVYPKNGDWSNGKNIQGNDPDVRLGVGVKIKINIPDELDFLDRIIIYRIQYVENGQLPIVSSIYDQKWVSLSDYYIDTGLAALQEYTLEEYNSISGIHIIPKVIESKFDYMFAANIKDGTSQLDLYTSDFDARSYSFDVNKEAILYDHSSLDNVIRLTDVNQEVDESFDCYNIYNDMSTEYPDEQYKTEDSSTEGAYCRYDLDGYYGGSGKYVSWRFIVTTLEADTCLRLTWYGSSGSKIYLDNNIRPNISKWRISYVKSDGTLEDADIDLSSYVESTQLGLNYSNPIISYLFKSLRRDELYRYGIVLYNKRGEASSVKWIADIRTPGINYKGFNSFLADGKTEAHPDKINLVVKPLGIHFTVDLDKYNLEQREKLGDDYEDIMEVTKYEIVRCNRTESDIATISQGVLSRPVRKIYNRNATNYNTIQSPYTATGYLTTANFWQGNEWKAYNESETSTNADGHECCNYENHTLFQFVSPEILYQYDNIELTFSNYNISLNPIKYLFNQSGEYSPDNYYCLPEGSSSEGDYPNNWTAQDGNWAGYHSVYAQAGLFNMSIGLFYPLTTNDDRATVIGTRDADNLVRGVSLKSLFSPSDYVIPQYYSVYPTLHSFSGSDKARWTGTYAGTSSDGYTDVISHTLKDRDFLPLSKNMYGYSKLYQQSSEVYLRSYSDNSTYEQVIGNPDQYDTVYLGSNNYSCGIEDFKIANEIGWNEMYEDVTQEDNVTTNYVYPNTISTVGSFSFVNCVCGPTINETNYLTTDQVLDTAGILISDGGPEDFVVGPGGRTALIQVEDDNILYKSIATANIECADNYNHPSILTASENYATLDHNQWQFEDDINPDDYDRMGGRYIFRNSIAGTFLCNIRSSNVPYGGYDYTSRTLSTYYSYGDVFDATQDGYVFDGDCYIMPMEYVSMHKYYYPRIKYPATTSLIYAIPVETNINLAYTYGSEFSRNNTGSNITNLQIQPSDVNGYYSQTDPLYNYNTIYSTNNYTNPYSAYISTDDSNDIENLDYRCYYSQLKTNNENIDSWTTYQPANYLDVDSKYGEITHMRAFKDNLMFWQDDAVGVFSVNERALITDNSNTPLILGTGGILSRYDYIDLTSGMSPEKFCDTMSMSTLYWYDDENSQMKSYGGQGYVYMNETYNTNTLIQSTGSSDNPLMFYDQLYSELVSKVLNNDYSLGFNEKYNIFTSVYEIPFDSYVQFDGNTYLITHTQDSIKIHKWNSLTEDHPVNTQGSVIPTYVQYVVNKDPLTTKVFDNQEIVTSELIKEPKYDNNYFSTGHEYNWSTDLNSTYTSSLKYTDREGNFRYGIPRAMVDGKYAVYGNRIRGKYMICDITDNTNDYNTSISYIITKFRQSWT